MTLTPLLDFFKRGEVNRDVRLLAAQGGLAPYAVQHLSILVLLLDDGDRDIREAASSTLDRIPTAELSTLLAGSDAPADLREFFAERGVLPAQPTAQPPGPAPVEAGLPSDPATGEDGQETGDARESLVQKLAKMTFPERLAAASKGSREMRAFLVRDPNKMVAAAVMSSPKLTEAEIEGIARMASVSEDVLRIIASNRAWMKNYKIASALTRNPKTPVALSMNLLQRLNERDVAQLAVDRNVPEPIRIAARKKAKAATGN